MSEQKTAIDKLLAKVGLTTIKLEAQVVKMETMKLDDGMTVIEAESFEPKQPVMIVAEDDQKIALPVGVYGLEDGRELIVKEEGLIDTIVEVAAEEEVVAPVEAEVATPTMPTPKRTVESVSKESYFSKATEEDVIELISKVIDLKLSEQKAPEVVEEIAKPIAHNPERGNVNLAKSLNTKEGFTEWLNNRK